MHKIEQGAGTHMSLHANERIDKNNAQIPLKRGKKENMGSCRHVGFMTN